MKIAHFQRIFNTFYQNLAIFIYFQLVFLPSIDFTHFQSSLLVLTVFTYFLLPFLIFFSFIFCYIWMKMVVYLVMLLDMVGWADPRSGQCFWLCPWPYVGWARPQKIWPDPWGQLGLALPRDSVDPSQVHERGSESIWDQKVENMFIVRMWLMI